MIQFNLLPDVKLHYIKAERQKRLVIAISTIVIISCLVLLVLLVLIVNVAQRKHINALGDDMTTAVSELREIQDLDKILTVQSQLNSIDGLHDQKVVTSRLAGFISGFTPNDVTISSFKIDYTANTIEIAGSAPTLQAVNRFADSLKYTTYIQDGANKDARELPAVFANVVLTTVTRQKENASYVFNMSFDPKIFSGDSKIQLRVLNNNSAERPQPLFQVATEEQAAAEVEE
jgi:Tfp pilus assembly protein PilN